MKASDFIEKLQALVSEYNITNSVYIENIDLNPKIIKDDRYKTHCYYNDICFTVTAR
jgi:hypothetical protein